MPTKLLYAPAGDMQARFVQHHFEGWSNTNVALGWTLHGRLDRGALIDVVDELFARHEALRTTLTSSIGGFRQCIWPFQAPPITEVRIRSARSLSDPVARAAIAAQADAPFDVDGGLTRGCLFSTAHDTEHAFLLTMHHAVSDGESCAVLDDEFRTALATRLAGTGVELPRPSAQFRDYVEMERGAKQRIDAAFWQPRIAPTNIVAEALNELPPSGTTMLGIETRAVGKSLVQRLHEIALQHRATFGTVVFGAVAVALSPWTTDALRLGVVHANRFDQTLRSVVGPVFSVLPLRVSIDRRGSFASLLSDVKAEWLASLQRRIPFGALVDMGEPGRPGRHSVSDVWVNLLPSRGGSEIATSRVAQCRMSVAPYATGVGEHRQRLPFADMASLRCSVMLAVDSTGRMRVALIADPRLWSRESVIALGDHLADVFSALAGAPDVPIRVAVAGRRHIAALDPRPSRT